jgi:hypothetical protein
MKGKKGDVSVTLLVMMTVGISIASLLIFYLSENKIISELQSPRPVLNIYAERELLGFYAYDVLRQSVIESYNELAGSRGFISETPICEEFDGARVFCSPDTNLKSNLENNARIRFFQKFKPEELKKRYKEENIDIELGLDKINIKLGNSFKLEIKNITFVYSQADSKIIVRHNFDISQEIKFDEIGMASFEEIYKKINECKALEFRACFKLDNFDVDIEEESYSGQGFYNIKMVSKANFFLNNELKPIEIAFLARKGFAYKLTINSFEVR